MTKFSDQVYEILRKVPAGKVTTYKIIAKEMKCKAYRAVGQVLKNNPSSPRVPCHRVVKSNGEIGGFMGKLDGENIKKKIMLLESEGVRVRNGKIVDFEKLFLFVVLFLCVFRS